MLEGSGLGRGAERLKSGEEERRESESMKFPAARLGGERGRWRERAME